jgi:hypothetical protein
MVGPEVQLLRLMLHLLSVVRPFEATSLGFALAIPAPRGFQKRGREPGERRVG